MSYVLLVRTFLENEQLNSRACHIPRRDQGCEENGEREKMSSTMCEGVKICGREKGNVSDG
jgi:hypothetical protein